MHFLGDWAFDHPLYWEKHKEKDPKEIYQEYFQAVKKMILSGYFQVAAHLDLIKKFAFFPPGGWESWRKDLEEIALLLKEKDMAYELNTAGLRKECKEIYPSPFFLKILYEKNIGVALSSDAHSPEEIAYEFPYAVETLKKIGYRKLLYFKRKKAYSYVI